MTDSFDPYRKWLGIPAEDQPPHHYRLLGIEPLESDPDVIANAADGRMAQAKNFQAGEYSKLSQKILNEIAAAKVCLLNAEKKAAYDGSLRKQLAAQAKPSAKAAPPARQPAKKPAAKKTGAAAVVVPNINTSSTKSYTSRHGRKRSSWKIPAVLAVATLFVVAGLIFAISREDDETVAGQPDEPAPTAGQGGVADATPSESPDTESPTTDPGMSDPAVDPDADLPDPPEAGPEDPGTAAEDPGRSLTDLLDPGAGDIMPASENPAVKPPIPAKDVRLASERKIRGVFKKELAAATTPEKKLALATKLLGHADDTSEPTDRFALLRMAQELAADAYALDTMLEIADRMGQHYEVDVSVVKVSLMEEYVKRMLTGSPPPEKVREVASTAMGLCDEAVATDDFTAAGRLVRVAAMAAKRIQDLTLIRTTTTRDREIDRLKFAFSLVKKAKEVLEKDPSDGSANLTVGQWYCFSIGNFAQGLPLLAKGANADLAELADQDLDEPEDAKQQVGLANRWLKLAGKAPSFQQPRIRARAAFWLGSAVPNLTGLDKVQAEQQLQKLTESSPSAAPRVLGIVQSGNVALATNNTKVTGIGYNAAALLDGETRYERTKGFAYGKFPCEWTITFDKVYRLREIRFLLYDLDTRVYRFSLAVSVDGKTFVPLGPVSMGRSSQRIPFTPRPVKAIKIRGLHNTTNDSFHVVEFEAYCIPPR